MPLQKIPRTNTFNRRQFLKRAALTTGAVTLGTPILLRGSNLNSKLNIAGIGVMGKGRTDLSHCSDENIVALCDVDAARAAEQTSKYSKAKFFQDYRKMFDKISKEIDAVIVSTPDHTHAVVATTAMQLGKHIYCQKPLTQTIYEARYLRNLAKDTGVITQMGNQGSAADGLRRAVECIQFGLIGQVREVHVWSNRPVWPQGVERPVGSDPVPDTLDWDNWIGPAPMRPFKKEVYTPFKWRGWQDFGTGALGDMACHTVNMPFRALNLAAPSEISAESIGGMNQESYPLGSKIRFQFPARKTKVPAMKPSFFHRHDILEQDAISLNWYDGGKADPSAPDGHDFSNKPPAVLLQDIVALLGEVPNSAALLIGDKGQIFSPDDYGEQFFIKLNADPKFIHYKKHPAVAAVPEWIPRNPFKGDNDHRHHLEWINAIKEDKPELCYSRFAIGGQLTEIMLLGCVSLRCGKPITWDGRNMKAIDNPDAAAFIRRNNRAGWEM